MSSQTLFIKKNSKGPLNNLSDQNNKINKYVHSNISMYLLINVFVKLCRVHVVSNLFEQQFEGEKKTSKSH